MTTANDPADKISFVWHNQGGYFEGKWHGYTACVFPSAFGRLDDYNKWGVLIGFGIQVLNSARETFDTEEAAKARAIQLMRQYHASNERGRYP